MLTLTHGPFSARVLPEIGGSLAAFDMQRPGRPAVPILQGPSATAAIAGDVTNAAHFVMIPWVNRIPGGILYSKDRTISIPRNTSEPLPLHGTGWQQAWRVVASDSRSCRLETVAPQGHPLIHTATQDIALDEQGLTITVTLTNTGRVPMPAGIGFHPWFPRRPRTELAFAADSFWMEGPGHLPTDAMAVPQELDFSKGRPLPDRWRNNCYSGWRGDVVIDQPDFDYRLTMSASPGMTDLMLYTPPGQPYWAIEPQSCTTGQVHTQGEEPRAKPLDEVAPGKTLSAWCKFAIT